MSVILLLIIYGVTVINGIIVRDPPRTANDYKYSYQIDDPSTGDLKSQHEQRLGDVVSGAYSVVDPDGSRRIVHYTAHPTRGFKAVVTSEPHRPPQEETSIPLGNGYTDYQYPTRANPARGTQPHALYYSDSQPAVYFTPANEINNDKKEIFAHGQYFVPDNKYYLNN